MRTDEAIMQAATRKRPELSVPVYVFRKPMMAGLAPRLPVQLMSAMPTRGVCRRRDDVGVPRTRSAKSPVFTPATASTRPNIAMGVTLNWVQRIKPITATALAR